MDDFNTTRTHVQVACAEGIAMGLIEEVETGIRLTPKGVLYASALWEKIPDLEKLLLGGYIKKAAFDMRKRT